MVCLATDCDLDLQDADLTHLFSTISFSLNQILIFTKTFIRVTTKACSIIILKAKNYS